MATMGEIRDKVAVKLAHINDGTMDPALLESIEVAIGSSVEQLQDSYPVRLLKTRAAMAWAGSVQEMVAPGDLEIGREMALFWRVGSRSYPLAPFIDADAETGAEGLPLYYEVAQMTRWDDQQAATDTVVRLSPTPSDGGTLLIDYTRSQPAIEDEDTEIILNAELVAIDAAMMLVDTVAPQQKATLKEQWKRHSANIQGKQSGGREISFSPWRKRAD